MKNDETRRALNDVLLRFLNKPLSRSGSRHLWEYGEKLRERLRATAASRLPIGDILRKHVSRNLVDGWFDHPEFRDRCWSSLTELFLATEAAQSAQNASSKAAAVEQHLKGNENASRIGYCALEMLREVITIPDSRLEIPLVSVDSEEPHTGHVYYLELSRGAWAWEPSRLVEHPRNAFRLFDQRWLNGLHESFEESWAEETWADDHRPVLWRIRCQDERAYLAPQTDESSGGSMAVAFWLMSRGLPYDKRKLVTACHSRSGFAPVDSRFKGNKREAAVAAGITEVVEPEKNWSVQRAATTVCSASEIFEQLARHVDPFVVPFEVRRVHDGLADGERLAWPLEVIKHRRAILNGGPGSGKTVILSQEAEPINRTAWAAWHDGTVSAKTEIALYLQASSLRIPANREGKDSAVQAILSVFPEGAQRWLLEKVKTARCTLLIDSVDRAENPNTLMDVLRELASSYPESRYLATSRVGGYDRNRAAASEFVLESFSDRQIGDVLQLRLPAHANAQNALRELKHSQPSLYEALRTPLLLRMACELATDPDGASVAEVVSAWQSRVTLFERFTRKRLEEWPKQEDISPTDLNSLWTWVTETAFHCVGSGVEQWDAEAFKAYVPEGLSQRVKNPLDLLCRLGLIVQQSPSAFADYRWCHMSVAEYLSACFMARNIKLQGTWTVIEAKTWDRNWTETIVFLVSLFSRTEGPERIRKLLSTLLDEDQQYREVFHHRLFVASQCLRELDPDMLARLEGVKNRIITRVYMLWRWANRHSIAHQFADLHEAMRTICNLEGTLLIPAREEKAAWPLFSLDGRGPDQCVDWTENEPWPGWVGKILELPDIDGRLLAEVKTLLALMKTDPTKKLGGLLAGRVQTKLVDLLKEPTQGSRLRAMSVIAAFPDTHTPEVLDEMETWIQSSSDYEVIAALWMLRSIGPLAENRFREKLVELSTDQNRSLAVQLAAIEALPGLMYEVGNRECEAADRAAEHAKRVAEEGACQEAALAQHAADQARLGADLANQPREEFMEELLRIWATDRFDALETRDFITKRIIRSYEPWVANHCLEDKNWRDVRYEAFYALVRLTRTSRTLERRRPGGSRWAWDATLFDWLRTKAAADKAVFLGTDEELDWVAEIACHRPHHGGSDYEWGTIMSLADEWRRGTHAPVLAETFKNFRARTGIILYKLVSHDLPSTRSDRVEQIYKEVLQLEGVKAHTFPAAAAIPADKVDLYSISDRPDLPAKSIVDKLYKRFGMSQILEEKLDKLSLELKTQSSEFADYGRWQSEIKRLTEALASHRDLESRMYDKCYFSLRNFLFEMAESIDRVVDPEISIDVTWVVVKSLLKVAPELVPDLARSPLLILSNRHHFRFFAARDGQWIYKRLEELTNPVSHHSAGVELMGDLAP